MEFKIILWNTGVLKSNTNNQIEEHLVNWLLCSITSTLTITLVMISYEIVIVWWLETGISNFMFNMKTLRIDQVIFSQTFRCYSWIFCPTNSILTFRRLPCFFFLFTNGIAICKIFAIDDIFLVLLYFTFWYFLMTQFQIQTMNNFSQTWNAFMCSVTELKETLKFCRSHVKQRE